MFSGEILVHTSVWNRANRYAGGDGYDFTPMFEQIRPLVSSVDLAICHLETPLVSPGDNPQTFPLYATPQEILGGIAYAGYDRCSTASNHSLDQRVRGVIDTVDAFEAAGIGQSGMARSVAEAQPSVFEVNGVKVTHLSYSYDHGLHGLPADQPWWANRIDVDRILADARAAREIGAEVVIVSLHWGIEPNWYLSPLQVEQANSLTASGLIDLIVGHGTHAVQPIEQVNGVWVVYGMGNSLSNMPTGYFPPESQDGVLVQIDFEVAGDGTVTVDRPVVYPTRVDKGFTFAIEDVLTELASADLDDYKRGHLEVTLRRLTNVVGGFIASEPF